MNYYNEIKERLINDEVYAKVKDYSKERHKVITYYEIGELLNEAGGKYGDKIIDEYAKKLVTEVGKKYHKRTLFRMKQFYNVFSNEKVSPFATQLSWSHYTELLPIKDENKLKYYLNISINKKLSRNELRYKIKNQEYERLSDEAKNKLINDKNIEINDLIPNPIIIRNNTNYEVVSEKSITEINTGRYTFFFRRIRPRFYFYKKWIQDKIR